jgi:hypothetical protein
MVFEVEGFRCEVWATLLKLVRNQSQIEKKRGDCQVVSRRNPLQ